MLVPTGGGWRPSDGSWRSRAGEVAALADKGGGGTENGTAAAGEGEGRSGGGGDSGDSSCWNATAFASAGSWRLRTDEVASTSIDSAPDGASQPDNSGVAATTHSWAAAASGCWSNDSSAAAALSVALPSEIPVASGVR